MQLRKMTMHERELTVFLNEDYHAYNEVKALTSVQNTNFQLIADLGDAYDELLAQINTYDEKITKLKALIMERRLWKEKCFADMPEGVRSVMEMHYLSYMTFEKIAEELSYHVSSVKRAHLSGLEHVSKYKEERHD